jgi:hypothetical protein
MVRIKAQIQSFLPKQYAPSVSFIILVKKRYIITLLLLIYILVIASTYFSLNGEAARESETMTIVKHFYNLMYDCTCTALHIIQHAMNIGVCLVGEKWVKSYCSTFHFYLINIIKP